VAFWEKLPKSKRPQSNSYTNVKTADELTLAKLQCFSYIAGMVEPFLNIYQIDNPMLPYMYFDLRNMVKELLEIIVKPEVIQKCNTGKQLIALDLESKENNENN